MIEVVADPDINTSPFDFLLSHNKLNSCSQSTNTLPQRKQKCFSQLTIIRHHTRLNHRNLHPPHPYQRNTRPDFSNRYIPTRWCHRKHRAMPSLSDILTPQRKRNYLYPVRRLQPIPRQLKFLWERRTTSTRLLRLQSRAVWIGASDRGQSCGWRM